MDAAQHVDAAWEAIENENDGLATTHARRALTVSRYEIDAYLVLAHVAATPAERHAFLREAVRLGRKELADCFRSPRDTAFWMSLPTRPYMRAAHALAVDLWDTGLPEQRLEAIDLAQHLLRLNPNDNQGMRFLLLGWLPALDRWAPAARIAKRYSKDGRTETTYWHALHLIRSWDPRAEDVLRKAVDLNPHVPALLTRKRKPTMTEGDSVAFHSPEEAQAYAHMAHDAWWATPGAIARVKTVTADSARLR